MATIFMEEEESKRGCTEEGFNNFNDLLIYFLILLLKLDNYTF